MSVAQLIEKQQTHTADQRQSRRTKVFLPTVITLGSEIARAHILDISKTGTRVHAKNPAIVGHYARIDVAGEIHEVRIVWSYNDRLGLKFVADLTPSQFHSVSMPHKP